MEEAMNSISIYENSDPELYTKLKNRITYESLSVRYLLIELYGDEVYGDGLQAEKIEVFNLLKQFDMQPTNARQQLDDEKYSYPSLKHEWAIG